MSSFVICYAACFALMAEHPAVMMILVDNTATKTGAGLLIDAWLQSCQPVLAVHTRLKDLLSGSCQKPDPAQLSVPSSIAQPTCASNQPSDQWTNQPTNQLMILSIAVHCLLDCVMM